MDNNDSVKFKIGDFLWLVVIFGSMILTFAIGLYWIDSNQKKAIQKEEQRQKTRTIFLKDGREFTGRTYSIGRNGVLYIDGVGAERDGWSIRE